MAVLVSPELDQARSELVKALEARMMVAMVANCTVSYSGRTGSDMGEGERLVVLKGVGAGLFTGAGAISLFTCSRLGGSFRPRLRMGVWSGRLFGPVPL